jgi:hypothetical protein
MLPMRRPRLRWSLATTLVLALGAGCASTEKGPPPEGQVILQAGGTQADAPPVTIAPGPVLHRPALLVAGYEPGRQANWIEGEQKPDIMAGAQAGMTAGMAFTQMVPMFVAAWPIAAGLIGGMTLMGVLGVQFDNSALARLDPQDRTLLAEAATRVQPNQVLQEAAADRLARRLGQRPIQVVWQPTLGADTLGTNPLADARERGADSVLNLVVERFGLARGQEEDTYGIFVRVRAQLVEPREGRLRYERIVDYGPGHLVPGLPAPRAHLFEFLALDEARPFRHELREMVGRVAGLLADDPALPLGPP